MRLVMIIVTDGSPIYVLLACQIGLDRGRAERNAERGRIVKFGKKVEEEMNLEQFFAAIYFGGIYFPPIVIRARPPFPTVSFDKNTWTQSK